MTLLKNEIKLQLLEKKVDAVCKRMLLNKSRGRDDVVNWLEPIKDQTITEYNKELKKCQMNSKQT